ncbi:hypothetical protein ACUOA8_34210, partial [Escherichia sp. SS-MK2]
MQILRKSCNTVVFSFADCSELKGDSAYTMPGIAKKVKISSSVVGFMDSTFYKCVLHRCYSGRNLPAEFR